MEEEEYFVVEEEWITPCHRDGVATRAHGHLLAPCVVHFGWKRPESASSFQHHDV